MCIPSYFWPRVGYIPARVKSFIVSTRLTLLHLTHKQWFVSETIFMNQCPMIHVKEWKRTVHEQIMESISWALPHMTWRCRKEAGRGSGGVPVCAWWHRPAGDANRTSLPRSCPWPVPPPAATPPTPSQQTLQTGSLVATYHKTSLMIKWECWDKHFLISFLYHNNAVIEMQIVLCYELFLSQYLLLLCNNIIEKVKSTLAYSHFTLNTKDKYRL